MFLKERNEGLPPSLKYSYFGHHTLALNLILTDKVDPPKGGNLGGKSGLLVSANILFYMETDDNL